MEGTKKSGSSSLTSHGSDSVSKGLSDSSSAAVGIFGSLVTPPSSTVVERVSVRPDEEDERKKELTRIWNANLCIPETIPWTYDPKHQRLPSSSVNPYYREEITPPCHLSSSIYYGGQDMYIEPPKSTQSTENDLYLLGVGEDDAGSAVRGEWWRGSLYY